MALIKSKNLPKDIYCDLVLKNARIVNSNQDNNVEKTQIAISEGKVLYIGDKKIQAQTTIDLKGKVVVPGLINCHTHAAMAAYRGMADDLPLQEWRLDRSIITVRGKTINSIQR